MGYSKALLAGVESWCSSVLVYLAPLSGTPKQGDKIRRDAKSSLLRFAGRLSPSSVGRRRDSDARIKWGRKMGHFDAGGRSPLLVSSVEVWSEAGPRSRGEGEGARDREAEWKEGDGSA